MPGYPSVIPTGRRLSCPRGGMLSLQNKKPGTYFFTCIEEESTSSGHEQRAPGCTPTPADHPQGSYLDFCHSLRSLENWPAAHSACAWSNKLLDPSPSADTLEPLSLRIKLCPLRRHFRPSGAFRDM